MAVLVNRLANLLANRVANLLANRLEKVLAQRKNNRVLSRCVLIFAIVRITAMMDGITETTGNIETSWTHATPTPATNLTTL